MQEWFTSFWFCTGDKGAKLPPNRGKKNYLSFSEISWVFFNVLARFFCHFCWCNSSIWVAKCSSLLFTEEFVWLFALPFNKRKYLPYANPAFHGKQCTLWTTGHHISCSMLSNGFQNAWQGSVKFKCVNSSLSFFFSSSVLFQLLNSVAKRKKWKFMQRPEKVWPQCFVVLLKPFRLFPAALFAASPCLHICLVGLCLKFWTLHFMSYHFSSLPKCIWRAAHPLFHPGVRGHLVPVADEGINQCQP